MNIPALISWNWSPGLILAGLLLLAGYSWIAGFNKMRKTLLFMGGLILTELALALPLGPTPPGFQNTSTLSCALPGGTLFSLHMIRHILLLMLAPPLMVAGLPEKPIKQFLSRPHVYPIAKKLLNPILALPLGVGIMWFWHVPSVFNYLTTYGVDWAHIIIPGIETFSLLGIGFLYCWPVLSPIEEYRLTPLKGILYLFLACSGCSILGILITFASPGLYHTAFSVQPGSIWGITQQTDQQLGGLLMWVPGCIIYLSGVMVLLVRWFSHTEHLTQPTPQKTATTHY